MIQQLLKESITTVIMNRVIVVGPQGVNRQKIVDAGGGIARNITALIAKYL